MRARIQLTHACAWHAAGRQAHDVDNDGKLDFNEFCQFVRDREEGEFTEAELRTRFDALDGDKSGQVDMSEYLMWSLKDSLMRSSDRVCDLFKKWDEDGDGAISKKEFRKAVAALGYDAPKKDVNDAFDILDNSGDGYIEYGELKVALSKHTKKGKAAPPPPKKASSSKEAAAPAEGDDVVGTGEEDFETGMKQNAMERDAADGDQDGKLDFTEFCAMIRMPPRPRWRQVSQPTRMRTSPGRERRSSTRG